MFIRLCIHVCSFMQRFVFVYLVTTALMTVLNWMILSLLVQKMKYGYRIRLSMFSPIFFGLCKLD